MHPPGLPPDGDGDGDGTAEGDGAGDGAGDRVADGVGDERAGRCVRPVAVGTAATGCAWLRCRAGVLRGRRGSALRDGGRTGAAEACWCGTCVMKTAAVEPPTTSAVVAVAHTAGPACSAVTALRSHCRSATSSATPTGGKPARQPGRREARMAYRTAARAHSASSESDTQIIRLPPESVWAMARSPSGRVTARRGSRGAPWARMPDGGSRPTTREDHRLHRRSRRLPRGRPQQGSPGRRRGEDPTPRPAGTTAQGPGAQGSPTPGRSAMRRPPQRSSRTDRRAAAARPGLPWPLRTRSPAAAVDAFLATLLSRPPSRPASG